MNRISRTIIRYNSIVATKKWTKEETAVKAKELDMALDEYVLCQELKSQAVIDNTISLEEGMSIYHILGETLEHFNAQPYTHKAVVTMMFQELLNRRIGNVQSS